MSCRLALRRSFSGLLLVLAVLASGCGDDTTSVTPDAKAADVGAGDTGALGDGLVGDGAAPCVLPADCSARRCQRAMTSTWASIRC